MTEREQHRLIREYNIYLTKEEREGIRQQAQREILRINRRGEISPMKRAWLVKYKIAEIIRAKYHKI